MIYFFLALYCTENVWVRSGTEPEPPFGFMFGGFAEPNHEHYVQFRFEHCSQCSEPDRGQSNWESGCDNAGFRRAPAPWIELEAGSLIDGGG